MVVVVVVIQVESFLIRDSRATRPFFVSGQAESVQLIPRALHMTAMTTTMSVPMMATMANFFALSALSRASSIWTGRSVGKSERSEGFY